MNYLDVARMMKQAGLFGDTMLGRGVNNVFGDTMVGRVFGASPEQEAEGFFKSQITPEERAAQQQAAAQYDAEQAEQQQRLTDNMNAASMGMPYASMSVPGQTIYPGESRYHRMIRQHDPDKLRELMYANGGNLSDEQAKAIALGEYQKYNPNNNSYTPEQIAAINEYAKKNNILPENITQARFGIDGKVSGLKHIKQPNADAYVVSSQPVNGRMQYTFSDGTVLSGDRTAKFLEWQKANDAKNEQQIAASKQPPAAQAVPPPPQGTAVSSQPAASVSAQAPTAVNNQNTAAVPKGGGRMVVNGNTYTASPSQKYVPYNPSNYSQQQQDYIARVAAKNGITGNISRIKTDADGRILGLNGIGFNSPVTIR